MIRKWRNQKGIPNPKTDVAKDLNNQSGTYTKKTYHTQSEQPFAQ